MIDKKKYHGQEPNDLALIIMVYLAGQTEHIQKNHPTSSFVFCTGIMIKRIAYSETVTCYVSSPSIVKSLQHELCILYYCHNSTPRYLPRNSMGAKVIHSPRNAKGKPRNYYPMTFSPPMTVFPSNTVQAGTYLPVSQYIDSSKRTQLASEVIRNGWVRICSCKS